MAAKKEDKKELKSTFDEYRNQPAKPEEKPEDGEKDTWRWLFEVKTVDEPYQGKGLPGCGMRVV